jgi:ubiquinone biosynthesis protein UbiJ
LKNNLIAALNWAIAKDDDLHKALRGLAGKRMRIVFPIGGSVDWEIEADGLLKEIDLIRSASVGATSDAPTDQKTAQEPHVTIVIGADMTKGPRIEGDAMVAERLGPLVRLMKDRISPWERFWNQSPAGLLAKQVADYAIYEGNVVVSRKQADAHHQNLREFRDALDRLEKRIDALAR